MISRNVLLVAMVAAAAALAAPKDKPKEAGARVYRLQWRDLERMTRGRRISLTLPSGVRLQGQVASVAPDELALDVVKTSDKRAYPKGRAIVPRPEVQRFRIFETRRTWRILGTVIGGSVGAAVAVPIAIYTNNEGGTATGVCAAAVAVPAALGYLLGWAGDRKVTEVIVEPEGAATAKD